MKHPKNGRIAPFFGCCCIVLYKCNNVMRENEAVGVLLWRCREPARGPFQPEKFSNPQKPSLHCYIMNIIEIISFFSYITVYKWPHFFTLIGVDRTENPGRLPAVLTA
jgi:hypothetical protein